MHTAGALHAVVEGALASPLVRRVDSLSYSAEPTVASIRVHTRRMTLRGPIALKQHVIDRVMSVVDCLVAAIGSSRPVDCVIGRRICYWQQALRVGDNAGSGEPRRRLTCYTAVGT